MEVVLSRLTALVVSMALLSGVGAAHAPSTHPFRMLSRESPLYRVAVVGDSFAV